MNYLEFDSPFDAEIEEYWIDAFDKTTPDTESVAYGMRIQLFFNFQTKKLTDDEKTVLSTALETLSSFNGLDNFEWINDLKPD